MKYIVCFLTRIFFKVFFSIEVKGLENIPGEGRLIIASNHVSNYDPPAILSHVGKVRSDVNVLAKKELFKFRPFGFILRNLGAIPLKRGEADLSAIKMAIDILNRNECLLIFPEGTRNKDGTADVKRGISYLVKKTGANILPAKITYSQGNLKLGKIIIIFGKMIDVSEYNFNDKETFNKFPEFVMDKILSIS